MKPAHQLGKNGEDAAASFLTENGYEIVVRNFRRRRAEVDIIAKKEKLLVFAEVKTRATDRFGFPEEAVSAKKIEMLLSAAEAYLEETGWLYEIRFDILAVTRLNNRFHIHHIEDAFH